MNECVVIAATMAIMFTTSSVAYFKLAPGEARLPTSISWKGEVTTRAPRLIALFTLPVCVPPIMLFFSYLAKAFFDETNYSVMPGLASSFIINQLCHFWMIYKNS